MAGAEVRFAAGVPNVDPFGYPLLLTDLAVAAWPGLAAADLRSSAWL